MFDEYGEYDDIDHDVDYLIGADGEIEECGACGKPATHVDSGEPVCNKHDVYDVYGVSRCDF